jgi:hypothetical protein
MQEKITKNLIEQIIPIYGKVFQLPNLTLDQVKKVASENATEAERSEYYAFGITAFKSSAGILAIPCAGIIFGSIGIFRSFNVIIPIVLLVFLLFLSLGTTFEIVALKSKKKRQIQFTKKHLINAVFMAIFSTIFFSFLLFVGLHH